MTHVQNNIPDLIVRDLMMPVMDGETFLRALRTNVETASVPVMIVTAKTISAGERMKLQGTAETIIEKGAAGWIEAVRIMGGVLGQRTGGEYAATGE